MFPKLSIFSPACGTPELAWNGDAEPWTSSKCRRQFQTRRDFFVHAGIAVAGVASTLVLGPEAALASRLDGPSSSAVGANGFFDVRSFGAKGDGIHLDSDAINQAILAASRTGGGTVVFPAGSYLCELCALSELKNALRSGDIWVEGSRQFKNFDEYLLPAAIYRTPASARAASCCRYRSVSGILKGGLPGSKNNSAS